MQSDEKKQESIIENLLTKFSETRDSVEAMIVEVEEITKTVKSLFPDKFDVRYRMVFQERVRAVTELFKTLLDMKKEITKSIKDEIDLRQKVGKGDKFGNIESLINMSSIIEQIEDLQTNNVIKAKNIKKKTKKKLDDESILGELHDEIKKASDKE